MKRDLEEETEPSPKKVKTENGEEPENLIEKVHLTSFDLVNLSYDEKLKYASPISKPMAPRKLTKKLLKLIKKSCKKKCIITGLKNVQRSVRKSNEGIVIMASDVTPIDVISHMPVVCEEKEIPFAFVPLRIDISTAMGVKRPCVMVLVKKNEKYAELYDECFKATLALPSPAQLSSESQSS